MLTARQKKRENTIEYILYMWQVEDLLRACAFDAAEIERRIVAQYDATPDIKFEIREWYLALCDTMKQEGVTEKGHIQSVNKLLEELEDFHLNLLRSSEEQVYGALYHKALSAIVQLRSKSGGARMREIETCLTAVYGFLLLKMQGRDISAETEEGVKQISALLAFLAEKYKERCTA